jgi:translation initiation factor IF-2
MLIRRLTLTAFAALFAVVSSFALHATPALADQNDRGNYRNHDHNYGGDRNGNYGRNYNNGDWNRGRNNNNGDWNRGRYDNRGGDWNRGRYDNRGGDWNRGRHDYRGDHPHDRDHG